MKNKILFIIILCISLHTSNSKNFFNTDRITRLINNDSNLILLPLKIISGKGVKVINNNNFDKRILDFDKSRFPYIVLDGLFEGSEGNLISAKNTKCPFYQKNKISVSDFVNYKIINSFNKINDIVKSQILQIKSNKINISNLSFRITALVIGNIILEIDDFNTIFSLENSFIRLLHDLSDRPQLYSLMKPIKKIPFPKNNQIKKDLENIDKIINEIINKKNNSLILEMEKHNSYNEIFNFIKFFFFAGFETTSNQLTFIMYMLSKNKKWQNKIYEETKIIEDFSCLEKCVFLNSFIFETLRIHPIVNTSTRTDDKNIYIFNVEKINKIKKDNNFNPYRYLRKIPQIYTFQAGKRQCIGKRLSIVEMQLFIIHFVSLFEIDSNNNPNISYSITKFLSPFLELDVSSRRGKKCINIDSIQSKKVDEIIVTYKGESYNLSEYIFKHPGGKYIIKSLNHNDITEEFMSKHIDSINANRILDKFKNYIPHRDIFETYKILGINYYDIRHDFLLIEIEYENICNSNQILKNGNTVVFHEINGYRTRCFSLARINKKKNTFTIFVKRYHKSFFLNNLKNIPERFVFSFINSVYSKIKENDVLISIGSGLSPFISFSNKCTVIGSFRGNYNIALKNHNINNLALANTDKKKDTIYNIIDRKKISKDKNIYLCGSLSFVDNIKKKYKFKNVFYDEW